MSWPAAVSESYKATWRKAIDSGDVNVLIQAMPKKHAELQKVPSAFELANTDEARRLIQHGAHDMALSARPYFLPPGTPKTRLHILRKAFSDTLRNPELLAEAKKASLEIGPSTGEELGSIIQGLYKLDSAFVAKLKQVLVP